MNLRGALLLLALAAAAPEIRYFRYEGPLAAPAARAGQTCVAVDAGTFAHAAPGLSDLRLYRNATETPYVVREAMPVEQQQPRIAPLNLGKRHGQTMFEAAMPEGQYSDVNLEVTAKNFIATVAVTGSQTEGGSEGTELGLFTIFDLSGQKLGRSTVLHLPESDFRYLYFAIAGPVKPEDVAGLSVERVSAKQTYVTVADTNQAAQKGHATTVQFKVPANVPVERVEFVVGATPVNFSRDVTVSVASAAKPATEAEPPTPVVGSGNLLRVHGTHDGRRIDEEDLAVDAPWGAFGNGASLWTISIDNGDDAPLALTDVRLEMAERKLCFDAAAGAQYTLFFGDPALSAPRYDYATLFVPEADAAQAVLGAEKENPEYRARPDARPFTERHPALLWVALILVVVVLGMVAVRTAKDGMKAG
jgi:hypothetical protein